MKIERNLKNCLLFFILLFLITNFNKFFQKHTKNIHTYICIRYVYHLNYKNLVAYYALNYKMLQISQVLHEVNIILEVPFFYGLHFYMFTFFKNIFSFGCLRIGICQPKGMYSLLLALSEKE